MNSTTSTCTVVTEPCEWCTSVHDGKCPLVREIVYRKDGSIKRIKFLRPSDYFMPLLNTPPGPMPIQPYTPWQPTWTNGRIETFCKN